MATLIGGVCPRDGQFAGEDAAGGPSSSIGRLCVSEVTRFSSVDRCSWKEFNAALTVLKLKQPTAPHGLMSAATKLF